MQTHFHFIIYAHEGIDSTGQNFLDAVTIELISKEPLIEPAMVKARKLVPKKHNYSLRSILEHVDGKCV